MGWTEADYQAHMRRMNGGADTPPPDPKEHKYGAKKKVMDGHKFDSTAEANDYVRLKALQDAGLISELVLQPSFVLQEAFTDATGKYQRAITYRADFQYRDHNTGKTVIADRKGVLTPVYATKKKMFLKLYPGFDFQEWGGRGEMSFKAKRGFRKGKGR